MQVPCTPVHGLSARTGIVMANIIAAMTSGTVANKSMRLMRCLLPFLGDPLYGSLR